MKQFTRSSMRPVDDRPPAILHKIDVVSPEGIIDPQIERLRRQQKSENSHLQDLIKERQVGADKITSYPKVQTNLSIDKVPSLMEDNIPNKLTAIGWMSGIGFIEDDDEGHRDSSDGGIPKKNTMSPPDYKMPGILGNNGKRVENGLPEYKFRSVYQYVIPDLKAKDNAPWKRNPVVPPESVKLNILSVVASVSLGRRLNLEKIAKKSYNLSYDPDSSSSLVMRLKNPKATAIIFKSGKMIVTGSKSEEECKKATRRFARVIEKVGYRVSVNGIRIHNITASCDLGFRVRVHLLGADKFLSPRTGYYPELFSGVSIPLSYPNAKVMVFQTGSVLITGVQCEADLDRSLQIIYPHAKLYAI